MEVPDFNKARLYFITFILPVDLLHQENGMLLESTSRDWQHWQHSILVGASCP